MSPFPEAHALAAMLELARSYGSARSDQELATLFAERIPGLVGRPLASLALRDPSSLEVREFDGRGQLRSGTAGAAPRPDDASVDTHGWSLIDPSPETFVGISAGNLVARVTLDAAPEAESLGQRLGAFVQQLADAALMLAERSETARLRLYAGSIVWRTNVPIAIVGRDGRVRLCNSGVRAATGAASTVRTEDIDLLQHVDQDDRTRALRAHKRACRGVPTPNVELVIVGSRSTQRLMVDFEPIVGPTGGVDSVLIVGQDITRVRQLEDQVSHADRLAVVGQLAAGVVHELNNPLTSILVYSEFVLRRAEQRGDDQDAEKLRRIVSAAERIQRFAKNLITYARTERGDREPLPLPQVIDEAIAFCEPLLSQSQVSLAREYDTGLPEVAAVRGQIQQIFINLITNAVHAVRSDAGRIRVRARAPQASWIEVEVDDDGTGISPELREEIFRPFVTTKASGQGTGLGLSIVRNLVERHGGTVTVGESDLGGARFVVQLPVRPPSERPPARSE